MLPQSVPAITLVPRFIFGLRKLYARDIQGRRGSEIDTAFGLASVPSHSTALSMMVFADAAQNEGSVSGRETSVEEGGIRSASSNDS